MIKENKFMLSKQMTQDQGQMKYYSNHHKTLWKFKFRRVMVLL